MPNAAAHFDDDFGIEAPARKTAPRRSASAKPSSAKSSSGKRKKKGKGRFAFVFDMQRLPRYVAVGMSGTVVVGILVNALIMQKGHHPAPLFGKSIALGASAAPSRPAPAPAAPPKTTPVPTPAATDTPRAASNAAPDAADTPSKTDDAIGRLLQGGPAPALAERPNAKTVLGVQRALTKLGIMVKQTGTFGPQTRKAIERFEKDHHLAVKGEMSRRVVKLLASESHLKIDQ